MTKQSYLKKITLASVDNLVEGQKKYTTIYYFKGVTRRWLKVNCAEVAISEIIHRWETMD